MKPTANRLAAIAVTALAGAFATLTIVPPARAVTGGDLDVLPKGNYVCEVPGDAGDPGIAGGRHEPESDFAVIGDSSYRAGRTVGVYLLTGDRVVMTAGPLRGRRFRQVEHSFLRELKPDGTDAPLRCISSIQAIGLDPPAGRRCKAQRPQDANLASSSGCDRRPPRATGSPQEKS